MDISIIQLCFGAGLVLFGKRLFWIIIALAGFVFGLHTAQSIFDSQPIWVSLIIAALCAGAIVAAIRFLKNLAFGLGGFILGAYLVNGILNMLKLDLGPLQWVLIILGGAAGAGLMLALFNWALIILSTLAGAMLIVQTLPEDIPGASFIYIGLVLLGIIAQTRKPRNPVLPKGMDPGDVQPGIQPPVHS